MREGRTGLGVQLGLGLDEGGRERGGGEGGLGLGQWGAGG